MLSQAVTEFGAPLQETDTPTPSPEQACAERLARLMSSGADRECYGRRKRECIDADLALDLVRPFRHEW